MNIILGEEVAKELQEKFTVLELETVNKNGVDVKAYCVVPSSSIPLTELPQLKQWTNLHADLITEWNKKNYAFCLDAIEHLKGKFKGELDSFYDSIKQRIDNG